MRLLAARRPRAQTKGSTAAFSRANTSLPSSSSPRHSSEAARRARRVKSSCLTCNFFHGAEDVEALRVHRSDAMVHIPVGDIETHRNHLYLNSGCYQFTILKVQTPEEAKPVLFPALCREKIHNCISLHPWSFKVLGWMNGMKRAAHWHLSVEPFKQMKVCAHLYELQRTQSPQTK